MIHAIEEPTLLDLAVQLGDDDVAREYEELSEMEDLDALAPGTGGEGALLETVNELALVRDELQELATLEDLEVAYAATHGAEAESTDDRVARRYEGLDVGELDALAHWADDAESRELPDDAIERAGEWIGG
jgi:hypothetical protein